MSTFEQDFRLKLIANARSQVRKSKSGDVQPSLPQAILVENKQKEIEKTLEELRKKYAHLLYR
ncbi:hypothetical protein [Bacillus sp. FJAT-42315]|uniref:hypothetical protein n=1 Tax=Bacillus sp. FJAT-42315 TaxID=2014077 RepID=UPI000C24BC7E|nr:hypothetical protein [Bacillus sp. FJAT-42315]